jgi:hypothetical protein
MKTLTKARHVAPSFRGLVPNAETATAIASAVFKALVTKDDFDSRYLLASSEGSHWLVIAYPKTQDKTVMSLNYVFRIAKSDGRITFGDR